MGRKSSSKQNLKKTYAKEPNKFTLQRRKELAVLVDKLLKLTGTFKPGVQLSKNWEHHLEIESLLREVINIESSMLNKQGQIPRKARIERFLAWLNDNEVQFSGIEISEFEGYDFGLKAVKDFQENSLLLTVPRKVMMSIDDAQKCDLAEFITVDPLLQHMPNITLALFLLLEKNKSDSFWKPYIDILPDKYSTILYFSSEELAELEPSPVFQASLKLYRSIARQYAYFYSKIHTLEIPVLKQLQDIFTFENYRWAVSTVMTRQNNLQLPGTDTTAFIPLWDMCNHEDGRITTDFNKELDRGECYALRDFKKGEQIFIFYGGRSNADLFLHNGFVYPNNKYDSLSICLGVSSSDPLRETKLSLLNKLGLSNVTHYNIFNGDECVISAELLAFVRIFNMNEEELMQWSKQHLPGDLVSLEAETVSPEINRRAFSYLLTRCSLIKTTYKIERLENETTHRKNIRLLKECELRILEVAIKYLDNLIRNAPIANK